LSLSFTTKFTAYSLSDCPGPVTYIWVFVLIRFSQQSELREWHFVYQFLFQWHRWVAPPTLKSHWSIILDLIHQTSDWPAAWTNKSCLSGILLHQASVTVNVEHFKAYGLFILLLFANLSRNSFSVLHFCFRFNPAQPRGCKCSTLDVQSLVHR